MSLTIQPATLNRAYSALKVMDQPRLLQKLGRVTLPAIPVAGAAVVAVRTWQADPGDRKKTLIRQTATVGVTALASAWATRRFLLRPQELAASARTVEQEAKNLLSKLADNPDAPGRQTLTGLVKKTAESILKPGEIHELRTALLKHTGGNKAESEALLEKLIPTPAGGTGKAMLHDIKNLSLMGLFPVLGGIAGGTLGNILSGEPWRDRLKNQAQEGAFQYLANIVLCNVGAATALGVLELSSKKLAAQRLPRMVAMTTGIVGMGIIGGSAIANVIGKNILSPLIQSGPAQTVKQLKTTLKEEGLHGLTRNLYEERKPEALDAVLHADDFMVAGQLAGLQWMGSILPMLYGISALRSAAGYRNGAAASHAEENAAPTALATGTPAASPAPAAQTTNKLPRSLSALPMAMGARSVGLRLKDTSPFNAFQR